VDLGRAPGREFVDALLDSEPNRLGTEFRQTLYRQTRAHPLFTVELLRGMEERGDLVKDKAGRWVKEEALDWETLPARVEAVIAERVGRLPEGLRETLVTASVEGEEFTAEVVARAGGVDDGEMVQRLSGALDRKHRLVSTQGVLRADGQRLSRYRFRHILFQRYLYNSLDQVKRVHLHEAVGTALEGLYGSQTDEVAVELAYHFREAGSTEKAIDYLRRAGERAARMSAHEEAIAHFTQGLALLGTLPETPERAQQELMLQVGLIVALQTTRGYGDPDAGRACARARELCGQMGETPQIFLVLWLLALFYGTRGDHRTAHELVQQLLDLAERIGDPALVVVTHLGSGWNHLLLGELIPARAHLEQGIALYDPQQHTLAFAYGPDLGVGSLSFGSWALWILGYPEQALQRGREALALAEELAHPPSLAVAQCVVGLFHVFRRDAQSAQELGETCVRLCAGQGFSYWLAGGEFCRGWGLAQQRQVDDGIALMHRGIADFRVTGEVAHTQRLADLAWICGKVGRTEEGLALLDDALATVHRNSERFYEAEIHRVRGELLLSQGADEAEAEACFQRAIEIARRQSAKMWELRATASLCRLWQKQGKRKKARKRLAQVYGWFSEGFDTPDLQEARALLEALGTAPPSAPVRQVEQPSQPEAERPVSTARERSPEELSPFVVGPPITAPRQFFGRERKLRRIFGLWRRFPLQNVAVIGRKRSGKTSLLHYLKNVTRTTAAELRPGQRTDWLPGPKRYRWVFVDFQDARMGSRDRLLRHLLTGLDLPAPDSCDLDTFLDVVSRHLHTPAIVLMDEIGAGLASSELDEPFWWSLRSLVSHHTGGNLAFVLTSHSPPARLAQDHGKPSPFFNIFHTLELGPFTDAEARELIGSSPKPFAPSDAAWILDQSGRWPCLLQILCQTRLNALEEGETDDAWREEGLRQIAPFRYLLEQ
jgi:tetratricopeptide (TPR) repeat protein